MYFQPPVFPCYRHGGLWHLTFCKPFDSLTHDPLAIGVYMGKLIRYSDSQSTRWSRVDLDNGEPIFIRAASTGVIVKKSKLGIMGPNLYSENNVSKIMYTVQALSDQIRTYDLPFSMTNPILRSFTQAALEAKSSIDLSARLNAVRKTVDAMDPFEAGLRAIINKVEIEHTFSLTEPQWEEFAEREAQSPSRLSGGCTVSLSRGDSGAGVIVYDPSTGSRRSYLPLYRDSVHPPDMIVVGQYHPAGTLPEISPTLEREIASTAQAILGPGYSVSVFRASKPPLEGFSLEGFEFMITRFTHAVAAPSTRSGPVVRKPILSQAEEEAKQEQLEERERIERLSQRVEDFVKRFERGSDREREHLIKFLTEEGLIAGEGDEPQRSIDIGLAEDSITATLQAQDRNMKGSEYDLFKRRLTATTQAAQEQTSPGPSEDAIFLAMGQRADTIRGAYLNVMEREATGYFRAESELPASKDKVKAALILSAWTLRSGGKLDKRLYGAYRNAYGHLADFVSDELVARSRKEAELRGQVPQTHPGLVPKWKAAIVLAAWIFKSQGKLAELKKCRTLGEEYQRLGEEFIVLCDEFGRRLEALDVPSKMAKEKMLIQQALLPDQGV